MLYYNRHDVWQFTYKNIFFPHLLRLRYLHNFFSFIFLIAATEIYAHILLFACNAPKNCERSVDWLHILSVCIKCGKFHPVPTFQNTFLSWLSWIFHLLFFSRGGNWSKDQKRSQKIEKDQIRTQVPNPWFFYPFFQFL